MGWYNCHVTISCDVDLTSQPISERSRKVVFRDFRIENKMFQTEAERRRREARVKQSMEIRVRSCMYVCMFVCMYGIWNYLANQGT